MLYTQALCLALPGLAFAFPQRANLFNEYVQSRCDASNHAPHGDPDNTRPVGDLDLMNPTSPVGQSIANILLRKESGESPCRDNYRAPGAPHTKACDADKCCIWSWVSQTLSQAFSGCNANARAAIRLGFHDAGTWSSRLAKAGQDFGGADGSLVLSQSEINRNENKGLENIARLMAGWQKQFDVPMSDLIQFAATHAVVSCPLGPRIRFFAGRTDSSVPAPDGLLPSVSAPSDDLLDLFEDKNITPHELVALLGAHTTSRQKNVDRTKYGSSQDSTPNGWDVLFYNQTLEAKELPGVTNFASDVAIAKNPRASDEWTEFQQGNGQGQHDWNADYAIAYIRLSLAGVKGVNEMTECSRVLPNVIF